ncbi:NUDIX hydrolase [Paenibacillus koleovorans]|uniref:NUDIX hydrolase n=1 Tax=Paenibacillus koleovorans TaxID=121608 RepID=UPI000FD78B06|nr:NUDIX hydrolase [Paenibacillus koleovorans]
MEPKFCSACGQALVLKDVDGTERLGCPECSFVHWGNYSVGVGALLEKDGKYLLVRRAQNPGKGFWTNPGGYIEQLELIHETIVREVKEEAGIDAVVRGVVAVRDQPRSIHNLYVAFAMDYVDGEPTPDGVEVDGAAFFSLEEMQELNVAPFTRWLVDVASRSAGGGLALDKEPPAAIAAYGLFRAIPEQ